MGVGAGAAILCYLAVAILKPKMGYDDSLDVFGVHGIGGAWGAIAVALLGSGATLMVQLQSVIFTAIFAPVMTVIILFVLKLFMGSLSVDEEEEAEGLDLSLHSENAYSE